MPERVYRFLHEIKGFSKEFADVPLETLIAESKKLSDLDLPEGSVVIVRGDIDSKKKLDAEKLDSQKATLEYCIKKGWKAVVIGHRNRPTAIDQKHFWEQSREADQTLYFYPQVTDHLSKLLGIEVHYIRNWLNRDATALTRETIDFVQEMPNGGVLVLENKRFWDDLWINLWEADEEKLRPLAQKFFTLGKNIRQNLSATLINNAVSDAKNVNFSTVGIVPFMENVVMGEQLESELHKIREARKAKLISFSGSKLDKVKQLRAVLERGHVETVVCGGLVAMALIKAQAEIDGKECCIGMVETAAQEKIDRESFVDAKILEQAKGVVLEAKKRNIKLVLPVDFKLDDETFVEGTIIPKDRYVFDIGPKSIALNANAVQEFMRKYSSAHGNDKPTVFHNGVFGVFERKEFAQGTEAWAKELKCLEEAGFHIVVGGGEGRQIAPKATVLIGGGTSVLGMSNTPLPAIKAIWMHSTGKLEKIS
ncbi:MAG: phosphoglycerate kinase [Candidatus Diapherotrites archaeon]|nr:phosphoglycerate kinase [Candidatus Diapherotrites archaeon]